LTRAAFVLVSTAVLAGVSCAEGGAPEFDVVLRGGSVVDGSGSAPFGADVGLRDGRVAAVGDLTGRLGTEDVDVAGRVVAPGFVNLHSHARLAGLPEASNLLVQGVTTVILNADGGGPLDVDAQLERARADGLAVNVGANIGFNAVWTEVNGADDTRPSPERIRRMRDLIEEGLGAGAWGVSSGLDYKPAYFARTDEVIGVLRGLGRWRTVFTNHDRLVPETGFSSMLGMRETARIGEAAGLVPVITHMKIQGHEQSTSEAVTGMMRQAGRRGVYIAADAYPYLAGQTSLSALIVPGWAQAGGRDAMLARLDDAELRRRIVAEATEAIEARFGDASNVMFPATRATLSDVMEAEGTASPGEAVARVLTDDDPSVILSFGIQDDLDAILRYPTTSVACDCDAVSGPVGHPRYYGTFPRVLGRFVRERRVLRLEEAVRKMTGLPAVTIGMVDRGLLAPGMAADVVVFDPATVIDHASYEDPPAPPDGIVHVLVNGRWALRDGVVTGGRGGRVLRRSRHMPARPLATDTRRSLSLNGEIERVGSSRPVTVLDASVTHSPDRPRAEGRLGFWIGGESWAVTDLGILQTHGAWASVTGWGVDPSGAGRGVTLIVDGSRGDASVAGAAEVWLAIDGIEPVYGTITEELEIRPSPPE